MVEGIKKRVRTPKFQEHYNQAQLFYNSLAPHEKSHLIEALSFELDHCDDPAVYEGYTKLLNNIDFELAKTVATNVGGVVPDKPVRANHGKKSASLSQLYYAPKQPTIASRRIAILISDGFNATEVHAVRGALASAGAVNFVIGARRGVIKAGAGLGESIKADHHFEGQRSTMFDAVFVPSGAEHAKSLASNGRVVHWVREAFGHCKVIGAIGEGELYLSWKFHLLNLLAQVSNSSALPLEWPSSKFTPAAAHRMLSPLTVSSQLVVTPRSQPSQTH